MPARHDDPAAVQDAAARLRTYVEGLRRRAVLAAGVEAVCAGVAALLGIAALRMFVVGGGGPGGLVLAIAAAVGAASGWTLYRRRTWTARALATRAEAHEPAFRNALVTAIELQAHPERASPRIRDLVARQAMVVAERVGPAVLWPGRRSAWLSLASAAMVAGAIALTLRVPPRDRMMATGRGDTTSTGSVTLDEVRLRVVPPPYTGSAPSDYANVDRIDLLAGSRVVLAVGTGAARVDVTSEGLTTPLVARPGGGFEGSLDPASTGLLTITALGSDGRLHDRRAIVLTVRDDRPPDIVIDRPGTDVVAATASDRVELSARATDDLALSALTLHYTRVTGSGEQFSFTEGEIPWRVAAASPREWRAATSRVLSDLGLAPGDLLVYYARAADRRPGAPPAVSDSYVIEIGQPQQAVSGGFAVPMEEDRQGLSLSALIQKTVRLDAKRGSMEPAAFAEAAGGLAVEQRMVRNEVVFLMGAHGHVEDEEAEAEHSSEIQEGRLENRGQAELLAATRLMTTAERHLTAADTRAALVDQRRALAALQRALSRQRYFLRTIAERSRIDPSRRLSGNLADARSWERTDSKRGGSGTDANAGREAQRAVLEELARAARGANDASTDLAATAARVLALDPASAPLQDAAAALVRLSAPAAAGSRDRQAAIESAARAVLAMSPASPASEAVSTSRARAAMQGALADVLEPGGRKR